MRDAPLSTPKPPSRGRLCASDGAVQALAALAIAVVLGAATAVARPRLAGLLGNTGLLTAGTLAASLPIGAALGAAVGKLEFPGRRLLAGLLVAAALAPLAVQSIAWQALGGSGGLLIDRRDATAYAEPWLAGWPGAIAIHAAGAVPWIALAVAAALQSVERSLEEEALLATNPPQVLRRVSLRRAAAGLLVGALWVGVTCATEISVTDFFQIRTLAEEIYTQASLGPLDATRLAGSDLAAAIALTAALALAAAALAASWAPRAADADPQAAWRWRPRRQAAAWRAAPWLLVALILLPLLIGLAWRAGLSGHVAGASSVRRWSALQAVELTLASPRQQRREWGWTLSTAGLAAATTLAIAAPLAWLARVRRGWRLPLATLAAGLAAVPAPLVGVAVITLLNRPAESPWSWLGWLYDRTLLAPVLVQAWRAAPLVGFWLGTQWATVPQELLDAARSEGAGAWRQLARVGLPMRKAGVAAAAGGAFMLAAGELSATLLVAPPGVTTIPVRVFQQLHYGADDRVAALALGLTLAAIAGAAAWSAAAARASRRRSLADSQ